MANIMPTYSTIEEKRPHLAKKKLLFHQDNAKVHTCLVSKMKFHELNYELPPHLPYSLDLALSDGEKHWMRCVELRGDYVEK